MAGSGRLLAGEVNPPVPHQQEVGNARERCVVCRAEVRHEGLTVDEALAVEVQMYAAPLVVTVPGTR